MPDADDGGRSRRRLKRLAASLCTPYVGEPPPGLYRANRPDVLIRLVGTAVPHVVSVVMRLGGDKEQPELPAALNRRTVVVASRGAVARDADVVELTLTTVDGARLPAWHPGAHIDIHLPSGRTRQYSLCGDPQNAGEYRIAVRRMRGGLGGSIETTDLQVGQLVAISDPRNAFMMALPGSGSRAEKLRFIAGGIGITPILPMVRLAERQGVRWSMCYTGRHRDSLPFVDELTSFGDKVRVRTDDSYGLPTAAELLDGVDGRTAVYMCGPPPLMEAVRRTIPLGSGTEVHFERFSALPVVDGLAFDVESARSGDVIHVGADQSALAAIRAVRPDLGYSCQQGFCGTCVQRVLTGEVDHRDNTLTDQQRKNGDMLICVSRAKTEGSRLVLDL